MISPGATSHDYEPITKISVILNASAGAEDKAQTREHLEQVFRANGIEASVQLAVRGEDVLEMVQAARSKFSTIVAGGGDGTINAIASQLVGTQCRLGILPFGTFNYFARNLDIPLDLDGAIQVIIANHVVEINAAAVNDRLFLSSSALGLYAAIVREREKEYERVGRSKLAAAFASIVALLRPSPHLDVFLNADGERLAHRTPLVFVDNNELQVQTFGLRGRSCLENGELAMYVMRPVGRLGTIALAFRALAGSLHGSQDLQLLCGKEILIKTRRKRVLVVTDGELARLSTPLRYRVLPKALRVIAPKSKQAQVPE